MMKLYNYLFYGIYRVWKKFQGEDNAYLAMLFLTAIMIMNFVFGLNVYERLKNYKNDNNKFIIVGVFFILFSLNYMLFIKDQKYLSIYEQFNKKPKFFRNFSSILILIIVLLTMVFGILVDSGLGN